MIARSALWAALAPFVGEDGRPTGFRLRDRVEVRGTFDGSGVATRVEVSLEEGLAAHPYLGPRVREMLDVLARALCREGLGVDPGGSRTAGGVTVSWSAAGTLVTFARKKSLLGGLFGG